MLSTLTIIGTGLIGGSVGLAARKYKVAKRIIGVGRRLETLERALKHGTVDEITTDVAQGVAGADLIVVCTPVESIVSYTLEAAKHAKDGAIVTDAGSTKQAIVRECEQSLRKLKRPVHFVGSHPMAGSERNGPEHARADLFAGKVVIVTPTKQTNSAACEQVSRFWSKLGARILKMSPADHDAAVAAASHVPHVVATALAAATPEEFLPLVAGGWLDSTRIAAGDPELWRQILSQNRSHALKALAKFEKVLAALRASLESEDDAKLVRLLEAGKRTRDSVGS